MYSNGGVAGNGNNHNTGNEKEKKHNDTYISNEVWKNMAPEIIKPNIESSKKGRPDQQSYGSQYVGKGPANDQKNQ